MKYIPYYTNRIKRQLKILKKRGYDMNLFKEFETGTHSDILE